MLKVKISPDGNRTNINNPDGDKTSSFQSEDTEKPAYTEYSKVVGISEAHIS